MIDKQPHRHDILKVPQRPGRVRLSDVLGSEAVREVIEEEVAALDAIPKLPPKLVSSLLFTDESESQL